jgi:putative transposase
MSTAEKVARARDVAGDVDLGAILSALELPRSTWYYHQRPERRSYTEKYAHLRAPLEAIARQHSGYGYRRTQTELKEAYGLHVNQKVVRRLHRCWGLPLLRSTRPPKPSPIRAIVALAGERANLVANLEAIAPFEVLYTDFTELIYAAGKAKAQLTVFLDHCSKLAAGWAVGPAAVTELALTGWTAAVQTLAAYGLATAGTIVHHDRDSVFTSYAWTHRLLIEDGVRLSYALRGASDNPEIESFFGRFKVENRSLLTDAETLQDLTNVVGARIAYYNDERRHSSLENSAPAAFLSRWSVRGNSQI